MLGASLAAGCSDAQGPGTVEGEDSVGKGEYPVFWQPSSALIDEHIAWHTSGNSVTSDGTPCATFTSFGGLLRSCFSPGLSFLTFHRNFMQRLRDDYRAQGLDESLIEPWRTLPSEMKNFSRGWTTNLQIAEDNLQNFQDGAGNPLRTLDDYGTYLEKNYHDWLHGIAANVYAGGPCAPNGTVNDCIVAGFMSPKSTYFFKIHGLIDRYLERFMRGVFDWDSFPDLITRQANGEMQLRHQIGTSTTAIDNLAFVPDSGCQWYLGAHADMDADGDNDLIWHGPGCGEVHIWIMQDFAYHHSVILGNVVGSQYKLRGAGDFTGDRYNDVVWARDNGQIHIWEMSGTNYVRSIVKSSPSGIGSAVLVSDFNDDGWPDLLFRSTSAAYKIQLMTGTAYNGLPTAIALTESGDTTSFPMATGRFDGDRFPDVVMQMKPNPLGPERHYFAMWNGFNANRSGPIATSTFKLFGPR